jgi:hypothetical protein
MQFTTCIARRRRSGMRTTYIQKTGKWKAPTSGYNLLCGYLYRVCLTRVRMWLSFDTVCLSLALGLCAQLYASADWCPNIGQRCYVAREERQSFVHVLLIFVSVPFGCNALWISINMADMIWYIAVGHCTRIPPQHWLLLRVPHLSFVSFMFVVSVERPRT